MTSFQNLQKTHRSRKPVLTFLPQKVDKVTSQNKKAKYKKIISSKYVASKNTAFLSEEDLMKPYISDRKGVVSA
jgi:hypothetical protein